MDPSEHFLGLRLNMYVASVLTVAGVVWFIYSQRRGRPAAELPARRPDSGADSAGPAESDPAGSGPPEDSSARRTLARRRTPVPRAPAGRRAPPTRPDRHPNRLAD